MAALAVHSLSVQLQVPELEYSLLGINADVLTWTVYRWRDVRSAEHDSKGFPG